MNNFSYGNVLRIERQYSLDDIYYHLTKMKEYGFNTVVIWPAVFWWEDKTNLYPHYTGCKILEFAEELGLKIIFELTGQTPLLEFAPNFIAKDEYFDDSTFGINLNHPEVSALIKKMFIGAASTYKNYPALYGYDIWNETHFEANDKYTLQMFRNWLRNKYKTIENLNDVWDKCYFDWSQITFRNKTLWSSVIPYVDHELFKKDNINMILKKYYQIINSEDPYHFIIADNIFSLMVKDNLFKRKQDDRGAAQSVDIYGISIYHKVQEYISHSRRWQTAVATHSVTNSGKYWVSELQTHYQSIFHHNSVVKPHDLKWWNWEQIVHGCKGIIYWKWDPFIKGSQTGGRGLLNHKMEPTPRLTEASRIAKIIHYNKRDFTNYMPERTKAAILYDKVSQIFTKALYRRGIDMPDSVYCDSLCGLYQSLWEQNIPSKFIEPEDIIDGSVNNYNVLFITNQLNIDDNLSEGLKQFVKQGGIVIIDAKFGEIGNDGILHKSIPGGKFNEILGYEHVDIDPDSTDIELDWNNNKIERISGNHERRIINVYGDNVEIMGKFDDNSPAIVKSTYGRGEVIFICTFLWQGYFLNGGTGIKEFTKLLKNRYEMVSHSINNNKLKFAVMSGKDGKITCVFNYGDCKTMGEIKLSGMNKNKYKIKELYSNKNITYKKENNILKFSVEIGSRDVQVFLIKEHNS